MIKILNMNFFVAMRKSVLLFMSFAIVLFACRKKYAYDFVDGTPGDGASAPSIKVDTNVKFIDASKYAQARVFPGLVCADAQRLTNQKLVMDLNYHFVGDDLRISVPPQPLFSTGFYAAPGELVIIDVPDGIYSLSVQVGAWTDNLTTIQNPERDPIIFSRTQLAPGRNYIRNLYGGHVYINAATPVTSPVTLTFSNVIKSPDFILGVTSNADWKAAIQSSCVPWLELRSKNIIFTVPREYCVSKQIDDPTALLTEWDNAINVDYYLWEKLSETPADPVDKSPLLPWRVVMDIKPVVGYGHNGYPVVTYNDYGWFNEISNINRIRGGGCWGIFHELGHNNQQTKYWSWSTIGETTCNLFVFKVAKRQSATNPTAFPPTLEQPSLITAFPSGLAFAADTARAKNFDGTDTRINNPFSRITPFIQLFDKVPAGSTYDGWKLMGELYSNARKAQRISLTDQDKRDFLYETVCRYTGLDWRTFFVKWGIQISNISLNKMSVYPLMLQDIWNYNPLNGTGGNNIVTDTRPNWTFNASSWSTTEGTNGYVSKAFDGYTTTYWHSNYGTGSGATAPPHTISVDMGRSMSVKGFTFALRQSGTTVATAVKYMKVQYSTDGVNYTDLTSFTPASTKSGYGITMNIAQGLQNFLIAGGPLTFRYFKLIIPTTADNSPTGNNSALSEINIIQ